MTYTTVTLHGTGGDKNLVSTLPLTAYFRYSKADISPIYCNDIYGTNMTATKDIKLGVTSSKSFSQDIIGLTPDTIYYYCAIISNKEKIAYGGEAVVKQFHTSPYQTTVRTIGATEISNGTCPTSWTGTYPNCVGPTNSGTCPTSWIGTYPNCVGPTPGLATLNGSFSSIENVTTYFQYKKVSTDGTPTNWSIKSEKTHNKKS